MIDYSEFLKRIHHTKLKPLGAVLESKLDNALCPKRYGDLPKWIDALKNLPPVTADHIDLLNDVTIGLASELSSENSRQTEFGLRQLIPWRKGPFNVFGNYIDTEWRSDWKWNRVLPHLQDLEGRSVLDVGCGNGYHCLRMHGAGAAQVIGIDPSPRFVVQFYMLKHFLGAIPVEVLPLTLEAFPENSKLFDTTFSMGVLYHRRSPMDHLRELKDTLRPGGQLILETLVVDGPLGYTLVPEERYAMMNNVWFLPSIATLLSWVKKCGFKQAALVDESITTMEEQRATEWMQFHSLKDFLDPNNPSKTREGHPAPIRAIISAIA